jgi:hypothetical protein
VPATAALHTRLLIHIFDAGTTSGDESLSVDDLMGSTKVVLAQLSTQERCFPVLDAAKRHLNNGTAYITLSTHTAGGGDSVVNSRRGSLCGDDEMDLPSPMQAAAMLPPANAAAAGGTYEHSHAHSYSGGAHSGGGGMGLSAQHMHAQSMNMHSQNMNMRSQSAYGVPLPTMHKWGNGDGYLPNAGTPWITPSGSPFSGPMKLMSPSQSPSLSHGYDDATGFDYGVAHSLANVGSQHLFPEAPLIAESPHVPHRVQESPVPDRQLHHAPSPNVAFQVRCFRTSFSSFFCYFVPHTHALRSQNKILTTLLHTHTHPYTEAHRHGLP